MTSDKSLTLNTLCVVGALFLSLGGHAAGNQDWAFIIAFLIAAAGTLSSAWWAASGNDTQMWAGPVMVIILVAILDNFTVSFDVWNVWSWLLIAVSLGVSILGFMNPGRNRVLLVLLGVAVGWLGVGISALAIRTQLPIFNHYIAIDTIQTLNPLHIDFFGPHYSPAEMADRIRHNAAPEHDAVPWRPALFVLQTVLASAWDALLMSVGVWILGGIATVALNVFKPANA